MEELIRSRIREALDVEPTPAGLRSRVISSVPMIDRPVRQPRRLSFPLAGQWAAGLVAVLLAIAIVAGFLYTRGALGLPTLVGPHPVPPPKLIAPEGIAVGPDGTAYVSDWFSNMVFRINPDGSLAPVAGGGAGLDGPAIVANLFGPTGLAIDREGSLYVADSQGGTIRKISNGQISTFAFDHQGPGGLAFDGSGNLYVTDFCCGSSPGNPGSPFTAAQVGHLFRLDATGHRTDIDISAWPAPAPHPGYLAFDSAGNLYIADRAPVTTGMWTTPLGGCRIARMSPNGGFSIIAGTGTCGFSGDGGPALSAQLDDPNGIVFDSVGNLYFADSNNHRIRRIDKQGIITTVAGTGVLGYSGDGGPAKQAGFGWPAGLGITSRDLIYIADAYDTSPGRVRLLNLSDGTIRSAL